MKKNLSILAVCATLLASAQNTGINTTNPTNTLDVNGTLRVREVATVPDTNFMGAINASGVLQKIRPSRIVATNVDQASGPVNVVVAANSNFSDTQGNSYYDLGLVNTITVPAGKKYGVIFFYSIPMGTVAGQTTPFSTTINYLDNNNQAKSFTVQNSLTGYFGVGFFKNSILLPEPTRKVSIPPSSGGTVQMTTVAATYSETIDNTGGTAAITNTYALRGYVEHYNTNINTFDAGGTIRFNMYAATGENYNWGRGTLSYILFELP